MNLNLSVRVSSFCKDQITGISLSYHQRILLYVGHCPQYESPQISCKWVIVPGMRAHNSWSNLLSFSGQLGGSIDLIESPLGWSLKTLQGGRVVLGKVGTCKGVGVPFQHQLIKPGCWSVLLVGSGKLNAFLEYQGVGASLLNWGLNINVLINYQRSVQ